jgi:transcription antitermination protein NusB
MSRLKGRPVLNKRRAARFAAVQALYQIELMGAPAETVCREFVDHRLGRLFEAFETDQPSPAVDREWFEIVVRGAWAAHGRLDPEIELCLAEWWTFGRLGYLLRACLRAGAFELAERPDVPVKVVLNEYVELAFLFFDSGEPAFVNAVLDRLAAILRATETTP